MKGWQMYQMQQQAKQLRAMEKAQARAAKTPARKLGWIERWLLGVKK